MIFIWSGFVRSGLGFGGAALALPLMLLILDNPLLWLPIVAAHLLFFSALTVYGRWNEVDWDYLKKVIPILLIPKIVGVLGLLSLPNELLLFMIYGTTFVYGLTYIFDYTFKSKSTFLDNLLLVLGGYASGVSLIGAPLMSAVLARNVELKRLRSTLFLLWMIMVTIKMSTFVVFQVDLQVKYVLLLLPLAGFGHWLGLKAHEYLTRDDGVKYKRAMGVALVVVCMTGLVPLF